MAKKKDEPIPEKFRSRIREFIPSFPTADLIDHPQNFRVHPEQQKKLLSGLLAQYGKIDAILCYQSEQYGGLVIIDGHQRSDMDSSYPVIVVDVTDEEARRILATYNPLAQMAENNRDDLRALAAQMADAEQAEMKAINGVLEFVLKESLSPTIPDGGTKFEKLETSAPPKMIWTVIGVPIVEFGRVSAEIERLAKIDGVIVESTASDFRSNEVAK